MKMADAAGIKLAAKLGRHRRGDIGIGPNQKEFQVWLWGDAGFNRKADYIYELPEDLRRMHRQFRP